MHANRGEGVGSFREYFEKTKGPSAKEVLKQSQEGRGFKGVMKYDISEFLPSSSQMRAGWLSQNSNR